MLVFCVSSSRYRGVWSVLVALPRCIIVAPSEISDHCATYNLGTFFMELLQEMSGFEKTQIMICLIKSGNVFIKVLK